MPSGIPLNGAAEFLSRRKCQFFPYDLIFAKVSSAYIEVSINRNDGTGRSAPLDVINIFDYEKGETRVNTKAEFLAVVDDRMNDIEWLRDFNMCVEYMT